MVGNIIPYLGLQPARSGGLEFAKSIEVYATGEDTVSSGEHGLASYPKAQSGYSTRSACKNRKLVEPTSLRPLLAPGAVLLSEGLGRPCKEASSCPSHQAKKLETTVRTVG